MLDRGPGQGLGAGAFRGPRAGVGGGGGARGGRLLPYHPAACGGAKGGAAGSRQLKGCSASLCVCEDKGAQGLDVGQGPLPKARGGLWLRHANRHGAVSTSTLASG